MVRKAGLFPGEINASLGTHVLGRRIYYLPDVDSTNRLACDLARAGEAHGTVVIADYQRRGRARQQRSWVSPPGRNLLFSILLRPDLSPREILPITLAFSVSIGETLSGVLERDVHVKWPNDVVVDGRKLCGILSEGSVAAGRLEFVVVGVGINVNMREDEFAPDIRQHALSAFSLTGRESNRTDVLVRVLGGLERTYVDFIRRGFEGIRDLYTSKLAILNQSVSFVTGGTVSSGTVKGVGIDGGLIVELADTRRAVLYDQEVTLIT